MKFKDDFELNIDSFAWVMFLMTVWCGCLILVILGLLLIKSFGLLGSTDFVLPDFVIYLSFPLCGILTNYIDYKCNAIAKENQKYPTFKFWDFQKWYAFKSERFIFSSACFLYYILKPDCFMNQSKIHLSEEDERQGKIVCLMPKSFIDYCIFGLFMRVKYHQFKKIRKTNIKHQNNKEKAENTLLFLNSLESEIEKELRESSKIIKEEADKLCK